MSLYSPSDIDISLPGILNDCRQGFLRCECDGSGLDVWAKKWGQSLLDECENPSIEPDTDEIDGLSAELDIAENRISELVGAGQKLIDRIEDIIENQPKDRTDLINSINDAIAIMENVL